MTSVKDEFITKIIKKEVQQRQNRKNMKNQIKDIISALKNADTDEYLKLLNKMINRIKEEQRRKTKKVVTRISPIEMIKMKKYRRLTPYNLRKNNLKNDNMIVSKNSKYNKNTLKNSANNIEFPFLRRNTVCKLQKQVEKKKKEINSKIKKQTLQSQIDELIASVSNDTVVKLIEMLQRDIRHCIRQIELLTGQKMTIESKRWSVEKVCFAKLADIRTQEDLWAAYVRGFTKGYRSAEAKLHLNSEQAEQQLEVKSNSTLIANSSPLEFCHDSRCVTVSKQENQSDALAILPIPSIVKNEVPLTCNEVGVNQTVKLEPLETIVLKPDIDAYFDTQMINDSSMQLYENAVGEMMFSQNGVCATFGAHMLCGGDFAFEVDGSARLAAEQLPPVRRQSRRPGDEPHACDYCSATFKRSDHLVQHRRRHTGERAYACADCDKTFMHNSGLTKHRRNHHRRPDADAPFACDVCGKRFMLHDSLTAHYGVHAGNKARRGNGDRPAPPAGAPRESKTRARRLL